MKKTSLPKRVYSNLPVALHSGVALAVRLTPKAIKGERILATIKEKNQGTMNGKGNN